MRNDGNRVVCAFIDSGVTAQNELEHVHEKVENHGDNVAKLRVGEERGDEETLRDQRHAEEPMPDEYQEPVTVRVDGAFQDETHEQRNNRVHDHIPRDPRQVER